MQEPPIRAVLYSGLTCAIVLLAGCSAAGSPKPPEAAARLLRVVYRVGEQYESIDVDRPLALAPPPDSIDESAQKGPWAYEVLVPQRGSLTVLDDDGAPSQDGLLLCLRKEALGALRQSAQEPRRRLAWQATAFAGFIGAGLEPAEVDRVLSDFLTPQLTEAMAPAIYSRAHLLEASRVEAWRSSDNAAIRLVPLVRSARLGSKRDLDEILRLSLEYHSALPFFNQAVRAVFPQALNGEVYRAWPSGAGTDAAGFLNAVHRGLARASHVSGASLGWKLSAEP